VSSGVGDSVDVVLAEWQAQQVGLDFSPVGVVMRLGRVRAHLETGLVEVFAGHGLTAADFEVVVTLRRAGTPFAMLQSRLMAALGLTSGTVSVRLDRLDQAGIVTRAPDPADRRGSLVRLTDRGVELFDRIAPEHLANEARLLSALEPAERDQLAELLRRLLLSFENVQSPLAAQLGLRLEPNHVAGARRAAVGLAQVAGLLVTQVVTDSPADRAGLLRGDVLSRVAGRPVLGVEALHDALATAAGPVEVVVVRGPDRVRTTLDPGGAAVRRRPRPAPGPATRGRAGS